MSAAFILIGSKVGDLIGRKRAYVLGLLGYAVGALAMTLAQSLTAIIVFWAIIGGLGASLLLPAMQSLIHGNFEGAAQKQGRTRWSARPRRSPPRSARCSAASSRPTCRGASRSCSRSSIIAIVLSGIKLVHDVPYTGTAQRRRRRRGRSRWSAWAASCSASSSGRRAASPSARCSCVGAVALGGARLLARAPQAAGQADADRPRPVQVASCSGSGISAADAAADRPRRHDDRAADLPADGARVQRDGGGPVARAAVAQHVRASRCSPGSGPATGARAASSGVGFALLDDRRARC